MPLFHAIVSSYKLLLVFPITTVSNLFSIIRLLLLDIGIKK